MLFEPRISALLGRGICQKFLANELRKDEENKGKKEYKITFLFPIPHSQLIHVKFHKRR